MARYPWLRRLFAWLPRFRTVAQYERLLAERDEALAGYERMIAARDREHQRMLEAERTARHNARDYANAQRLRAETEARKRAAIEMELASARSEVLHRAAAKGATDSCVSILERLDRVAEALQR